MLRSAGGWVRFVLEHWADSGAVSCTLVFLGGESCTALGGSLGQAAAIAHCCALSGVVVSSRGVQDRAAGGSGMVVLLWCDMRTAGDAASSRVKQKKKESHTGVLQNSGLRRRDCTVHWISVLR